MAWWDKAQERWQRWFDANPKPWPQRLREFKENGMSESEVTRFRSFAERYVVARATAFRSGAKEEEADAWECVLRARSVYSQIESVARGMKKDHDGTSSP